MRFNPGLQPGDQLTFGQLRNIFQCSNAGGVLLTKKFQTLVIVSNHIKGVADDRWEGDVLHYTGMGMNGDQTIEGNHNRILSESNVNGVTVHLFEVYVQNEYIYRGIVKLVQEPYQEFRKDGEGNIRRVWVFPVKVAGDEKTEDEEEERRLADRVSLCLEEELEGLELVYRRAPRRKEKAIIRNGAMVYQRSTKTALNALAHARFCCEIPAEETGSHETIKKANSDYDLVKPRHLIPMRYQKEFKYSLDVEENIVALCPVCYEKICYGKEKEELLKYLYEERKDLLKAAGIEVSLERLLEMYA